MPRNSAYLEPPASYFCPLELIHFLFHGTGFQTRKVDDLPHHFPKAVSLPGKVTQFSQSPSYNVVLAPHHPDHKLPCHDATSSGVSSHFCFITSPQSTKSPQFSPARSSQLSQGDKHAREAKLPHPVITKLIFKV